MAVIAAASDAVVAVWATAGKVGPICSACEGAAASTLPSWNVATWLPAARACAATARAVVSWSVAGADVGAVKGSYVSAADVAADDGNPCGCK